MQFLPVFVNICRSGEFTFYSSWNTGFLLLSLPGQMTPAVVMGCFSSFYKW